MSEPMSKLHSLNCGMSWWIMDEKTGLGWRMTDGLQYKLETLPCVKRAHVHADYELWHKPEHASVKKL